MKQVLINYLSTLSVRVDDLNYYIIDIPGDAHNGKTFEGFMTNEPVTKYCILSASEENEQCSSPLEYIISICSDTVREGFFRIDKKRVDGNDKLSSLTAYCDKNMSTEDCYAIQHYQYYKESTIKTCDSMNAKKPVFCEPLLITDTPSAEEIRDMIVKVERKIVECTKGNYKDFRFVLDCTGGDRSAAVMMIALTKMLEERGFNEIKLMGINYSGGNNPENRSLVREKAEMGDIFDLITGTRIFLDYGDAKGLTKFFSKSGLKDEDRVILEAIQDYSNSLKLCSPDGIVSNLGRMVNLINERKSRNDDESDLFNYLLSEIQEEIGILANKDERTAINIIKWCLRKGLIQQAVTLYSEQIPKEFVRQKIVYYPTDGWDRVKRTFRNKNDKEIKVYESDVQNALTYENYDKLNTEDEGDVYKSVYSNEINFINRFIKGNILRVFDESNAVIIGDDYKGKGKRKKLARNLQNYKTFKSDIRNKIMHADFKEGSMRDLIGSKNKSNNKNTNPKELKLKDNSLKDKTICPETIIELMEDLVGQLESLGMK